MYDKSKCNYNVKASQPTYQPSAVAQCCLTDLDGVKKFHSDIHLLLHDKELANKIGPDVLRSYLDTINNNDIKNVFEGLTDDQLMTIINDRRSNNLTDKFEFQLVLADYYNKVKGSIEYKQKQDNYLKEQRESLVKLLSKSKAD